MIYIPGQPPELQTTTPDLIRWVQMELERVSALSRIQEEDISAASAGGTPWDFDELNAAAVYTVGTFDFEEGTA